jgi:hypothetical protein
MGGRSHTRARDAISTRRVNELTRLENHVLHGARHVNIDGIYLVSVCLDAEQNSNAWRHSAANGSLDS